MIDRLRANGMLWTVAACILAAASAVPADEYIHEDARISGKEIHFFSDGGEKVSVILGSFRLAVGKHVVSGRDAVLWIATRPTRGLPEHEIELYVEGDARVVEPAGAVTTDRQMFVTVRCRGRLRASGTMSDRPLTGFPLYARAVEARRRSRAGLSATRPAGTPVTVTQRPAPATRPAEAAGPGEAAATDRPPVEVVRTPPPPRRTDPVHFHAKRFTSQEIGEGETRRRATIARGDVYLSQGSAESDLFLELRSQHAVVFSARRPEEQDDASVPWAPKLQGVSMPGGGREVVTGVYLEGDVVIARGERTLRGTSAFYDFTTNRAVVLDAVFRTVQEQRNIPVYVRATEARALSERELEFRNARVSTSDFHTPTYHIGASRAYLKNATPYDATGVRLGENRWLTVVEDATLNIRDIPVMYWPESRSDVTEGSTPLRKATIGTHGRLGFGGETEWDFFRLLGMLQPEGFRALLEMNWYERGPLAGINLDYNRETFHGYSKVHGLLDFEESDDFGEERKGIAAPENRGRILARHKHFLPKDWQLQFELSYLCDRNYLEQFFPAEYWAGKEQETLFYAKKQRDNWAFTTLLKYRLNRFQQQTEAAPELGFHLVGEPIADRLTLFSESRAGALRHRIDEAVSDTHGRFFGRFDTRNEIDWPIHLGPLNVVPYAAGRATYWTDRPETGDVDYTRTDEDGKRCRLYGQLGVRANMHFWRVFPETNSRLWDLHGLKHVITPEAVAFVGDTLGGVEPSHLWPIDPDIERHLHRLGGAGLRIRQQLQTHRGEGANRRVVEWMRLDISSGFYDGHDNTLPADGRLFAYRPEYSLDRDHLNFDYAWNISDATTFLADGNFDTETGQVRRWNLGLAVSRDPRLSYFLGIRRIADLDSAVGTAGVRYRINRKYSVNFFQQIDMDYDGSRSMGTSISLIRKFPRWYVGTTFVMDGRTDDVGIFLTLWPEGIPEFRLGSGRASFVSQSDLN